MDDPLLKHIETCGLPHSWNEILKGVGINSIEDLQSNLHNKSITDELWKQAKKDEEGGLRTLLYYGVLFETADDIIQQRPFQELSKYNRGGKCKMVALQSSKSNTSDVEHNLLEKLGLSSYCPEKITLETINRKYSLKLEAPSDIPWYVLSKLLMLDYRGRDSIISPDIKRKLDTGGKIREDSLNDDTQDLFTQLTGDFTGSVADVPHPTDVIVSIFRCSCNFVKQIICEKLFLCKLAIPLILPASLNTFSNMLLWPLRTIYIDAGCPVSALKLPMPVISCLRLGNISQSKSKLLNEILNYESHPTFFNSDCENGMNKRLISEGLVEITWQLHKSREDESKCCSSNKVVLNLRGNGKECEVSKDFLIKVSNVVIVMLNIQFCKSNTISEFLHFVSEYDSSFLLVITKLPNVQFTAPEKLEIREFLDTLQKMNFPKERLIFDFEGARTKNIKILKKEMETKLQLCLDGAKPKDLAEVFKEAARSLGISVDGEDSMCNKVQKRAYCLEQLIENQKERGNGLKRINLPMQCSPWSKIAELNKEGHRQKRKGMDTVDKYADKIFKEKQKERNMQLKGLKNPTKVFQTFLKDFLRFSIEQRVYYLRWLKICFDNLSRKILPEKQRQYNIKWNEISLIDDEVGLKKNEAMYTLQKKKLTEQLNNLENELSEASLGMEHFMRELAQAYEAYAALGTKACCQINNRIKDLPRIVAELMIQGFPLELMDGDAAHIPLVWVDAVLKELKQILGNKKIFVLSVLGIQSSGKSTLLNAMFGLQFAVSAGRCTRGVFAQLLPLPVEFACDKYEYLLVVDTEGLRASELGEAKIQHDNEIATFVIGIGDVTLVNIKGENVTEIEDVLQIVIHALLKMKLVNKRLALQPSCFFIHQNVPAPDAAEKLKLGQLKFMETLNQVTQAAGKHEDAPDITRFRQLIEFDYNTNIFYFPDLWKGDPPVAPVNSGYSEMVRKVKEIILKDIIPRRAFQVTIQDFCMKLKDLWNGILDQDFVFNFRNSLEIEAYGSLEKVMSDLQWNLKNAGMKWMNGKRNIIANSDTISSSMEAALASEIGIHLKKELDRGEESLESHFQGRYSAVLEQWKSRSFIKLKCCYDDTTNKTIQSLKDEVRRKTIEINSRNDVNKYKLRILNEAKKLANEIEQGNSGRKLEDKEMKIYFRNEWSKWMECIDCEYKDCDVDIESQITKVLFEKFQEDHVLVRESLLKVEIFSVYALQRKLFETVDKYIINRYIKNSLKSNVNMLLHYNWMPSWVKEKISIEYPRDRAKKIIGHKINDLQRLASSVSLPLQLDMKVILDIANQVVIEMETDGISIELIDEFRICIAVCFCKYSWDECNLSLMSRTCNTVGIKKCEFDDAQLKAALFHFIPHARSLVEEILGHISFKSNVFDCRKEDLIIERELVQKLNVLPEAERMLFKFKKDFEHYLDKIGVQSFKEEYIEGIVEMVKHCSVIHKYVRFTKPFIVDLAVHACNLAIPVLYEKHRKYRDNLNPILVLEKDYYDTYCEVFCNSINKISDEKSLVYVLSEYLCKAIQSAVDKDIHRELANDVRNNVSQVKLKSTLLKAILLKLLDEDVFEEFILYLENYETCSKKWVTHFIDEYLFQEGENGSRYKVIALKEVKLLVSKICENVLQTLVEKSEEQDTKSDITVWAQEFHARVSDKIQISLDDVLSLVDGYQILSLESFKELLCGCLKQIEKFESVYGSHSHTHLKSVDGLSVYDIIHEECVGCTESCPFCHSPCTLNSADHTEQGIKHSATEHYSQACAKYRWEANRKLVTENCTALVASDICFRCTETNFKWHPYKKYFQIFPKWEIHGDVSVEATPYWKWFMVKYESQLAEKYTAERPDILESWKEITKDMARESLHK